MVNEPQAPEYNNSNILSLLGGLMIGSLAGAMTMLFLAPQSGKRTRMQVQQKSIELRERTTEMVEDALAQVRSDGKRITKDGRRKAKELMQQGQELVIVPLEYVTEAVQAGKKALQGLQS